LQCISARPYNFLQFYIARIPALDGSGHDFELAQFAAEDRPSDDIRVYPKSHQAEPGTSQSMFLQAKAVFGGRSVVAQMSSF